MADDEDDYLSDKFLFGDSAPQPSKPQTYAERRKQVQRLAELKNAQNRKKSRRQLEEEALEEGLKESLFERAKEEEEKYGRENKALSMMMKMGFKPGQSLGRAEESGEKEEKLGERDPTPTLLVRATSSEYEGTPEIPESGASGLRSAHRTQPLSIDVWTGEQLAIHIY
jgi:hypothetical protein